MSGMAMWLPLIVVLLWFLMMGLWWALKHYAWHVFQAGVFITVFYYWNVLQPPTLTQEMAHGQAMAASFAALLSALLATVVVDQTILAIRYILRAIRSKWRGARVDCKAPGADCAATVHRAID